MQVWFNRVNQYRSSLYETARGVLRSRNRHAQRNQELTLELRVLRLRVEQLANESQDHQKRVGVAQLQQLPEQANDWIRMTDHSNQIGTEKVLQILGIRASQLPPPGQTLSRDKMAMLAVVPGKDWKRDDVRREYKKLAQRIGAPRDLLTDGAVELFESADVLRKPGKKLTVLRDMKHFAANTFEKLIGKDERFVKYLSQLGSTRSRIQQTELGHFTPPPQKPKARFMNLGPSLRWGQMVSHHLSRPHSQARKDITASRMNECARVWVPFPSNR